MDPIFSDVTQSQRHRQRSRTALAARQRAETAEQRAEVERRRAARAIDYLQSLGLDPVDLPDEE